MKILIVTNLYPLPWEPNRATFNKQQFDRLAKNNDVKILVPVAWTEYVRNKAALRTSAESKVKYVCYWYTPKLFQSLFGLFMFWSIWLGTKSWIKQEKLDCVLGSWAHPDGFAAAEIAKRLNIPYFIKVHGSDINILAEDEKRGVEISKVCCSATHVFTPSNALREKVIHLGVKSLNVSRLYNGVNRDLFYPKTNAAEESYFLFVGNLKKDKGVLDLIEAYKEYRNSGGQLPLFYIGSGPEGHRLKQRTLELGLNDFVTFLGAMPHEQVAAYVRQCSSLILPSYHEGVPNVLLEAANCGVPVIATKVGGIPEVVEENVTGLLFDAGDLVGLTKAMQAFGAHKWNSAAILAKGNVFSWETNVNYLEEILSSVRVDVNTANSS